MTKKKKERTVQVGGGGSSKEKKKKKVKLQISKFNNSVDKRTAPVRSTKKKEKGGERRKI